MMFIGGLLPFVQNTDFKESISDAYSFMNIEMSFLWYLFMIVVIAAIVLVSVKKEIISIIPTAIAEKIQGTNPQRIVKI